MALAATVVTFLLQTWAQARMSATHAAVIFALEPVFTALFAAVILGERLSGARARGAAASSSSGSSSPSCRSPAEVGRYVERERQGVAVPAADDDQTTMPRRP